MDLPMLPASSASGSLNRLLSCYGRCREDLHQLACELDKLASYCRWGDEIARTPCAIVGQRGETQRIFSCRS